MRTSTSSPARRSIAAPIAAIARPRSRAGARPPVLGGVRRPDRRIHRSRVGCGCLEHDPVGRVGVHAAHHRLRAHRRGAPEQRGDPAIAAHDSPPTLDAGLTAGKLHAVLQRDGDAVEDGLAKVALGLGRDEGGGQPGADNHDRLRRRDVRPTYEGGDLGQGDVRHVAADGHPEVGVVHDLDPLLGVDLHDARRDVIQVGHRKGDPGDPVAFEVLQLGQGGGRGGCPGGHCDRVAYLAIGREAVPAPGGSVPGDRVHLGVGQERRGGDHGAHGELSAVARLEGDVPHRDAREVVGQRVPEGMGHHRDHRFEHGVARGRDVPDLAKSLHRGDGGARRCVGQQLSPKVVGQLDHYYRAGGGGRQRAVTGF